MPAFEDISDVFGFLIRRTILRFQQKLRIGSSVEIPGIGPGLHHCERCVLPLSLYPRGEDGLRTRDRPGLQSQRSNQLSYIPMSRILALSTHPDI